MTNDRDLSVVDEVIEDLERVLAKLRKRRDEQEAKRADEG